MNRPIVNEHGELDIPSVDALSREDLSHWVFDRLHGHDFLLADDMRAGNTAHYLLAEIFPRLQRGTREDLQNIIFEYLGDLATP